MKYRNGAEINVPEEGSEYWFINYASSGALIQKEIYRVETPHLGYMRWINQNIFLTAESANKAFKNQHVFNRIYRRIKEIDVENNWICDYAQHIQKKYFAVWNYNKAKRDYNSNEYTSIQGVIYMSIESVKWLMSDEVSDEDFKIFVKY